MQSAYAVLYCHLWPVWLYHIFPHYLINGMIFGGEITEHKMCVLILYTSIRAITHSKKKLARCDQNCTLVFMWTTRYSSQISWNLNLLDRFSENTYQDFTKNPSSGRWVVPCGQTDTTKLTVALGNFANAPKKLFFSTKCYNHTTLPPAISVSV